MKAGEVRCNVFIGQLAARTYYGGAALTDRGAAIKIIDDNGGFGK